MSDFQLGFHWPAGKPFPNDPREMRKEINQNCRYSILIREAENAAHYLGLNGEDAMTLLAFRALVEVERYFQLEMRRLELDPRTPPIFKEPPHG